MVSAQNQPIVAPNIPDLLELFAYINVLGERSEEAKWKKSVKDVRVYDDARTANTADQVNACLLACHLQRSSARS